MKVLVVTDLPQLYENTMYLSVLEREMEKRNIEIDVSVVNIPRWLVFNTRLPIYQILSSISSVNRIREYNVIHVQFTLPLGLVYNSLSRLSRTPVIIHTHGYDVFTLPSMGIGLRRIKTADFLTKLSWKTATRIIAVCKEAKETIMNEGIDARKIEVLYNGVDEKFFRKRKRVEDERLIQIRESADLIFLNVGHLVPVKNQTRLLFAYNHFLKRRLSNEKTVLVICGVGPLKERLNTLATKLGLSSNIIFLGQLQHHLMPELYSIADVFILPSLSEAHPWSLLEAMSCELPATASNVGGIPETLDDKNLLFDPWAPNDICQTMIHLEENPEKRKQIGARNRRLVLDKFTLRNHVTNLSSIYDRVLISSTHN